MNSCCTYTCFNKGVFWILRIGEVDVVPFRKNKECKLRVSYIEDVRKSRDVVEDMRYFHKLKRNPLSINMFVLMGLSTKIGRGIIKISKGAFTLAN